MSNVRTTTDGARPQDSAFHNQSGGRVTPTIKNWRWHDPPILFPICLSLLILGYAVLRTPQ